MGSREPGPVNKSQFGYWMQRVNTRPARGSSFGHYPVPPRDDSQTRQMPMSAYHHPDYGKPLSIRRDFGKVPPPPELALAPYIFRQRSPHIPGIADLIDRAETRRREAWEHVFRAKQAMDRYRTADITGEILYSISISCVLGVVGGWTSEWLAPKIAARLAKPVEGVMKGLIHTHRYAAGSTKIVDAGLAGQHLVVSGFLGRGIVSIFLSTGTAVVTSALDKWKWPSSDAWATSMYDLLGARFVEDNAESYFHGLAGLLVTTVFGTCKAMLRKGAAMPDVEKKLRRLVVTTRDELRGDILRLGPVVARGIWDAIYSPEVMMALKMWASNNTIEEVLQMASDEADQKHMRMQTKLCADFTTEMVVWERLMLVLARWYGVVCRSHRDHNTKLNTTRIAQRVLKKLRQTEKQTNPDQ
jgi:hypothetical protein